jgi:hypothetical protein
LFAVQTWVISIVGLLAAGGYVLRARDVLAFSGIPGLEALFLPFVGLIGACCLVSLISPSSSSIHHQAVAGSTGHETDLLAGARHANE